MLQFRNQEDNHTLERIIAHDIATHDPIVERNSHGYGSGSNSHNSNEVFDYNNYLITRENEPRIEANRS